MYWILIGVRGFACAVAIWNILWSFRGVCEVAMGRFSPPAIYLAVVFWFSVAAINFQLAWLAGPTDLWRFFSLSLLLVALITAAVGHRRGVTLQARQFYRLYDHLGEAQAIADLADVDPVAAERIATECRSLTVAALIARRG